jgi:hypothetical protein
MNAKLPLREPRPSIGTPYQIRRGEEREAREREGGRTVAEGLMPFLGHLRRILT